jgi:hypothetical protein
MFREIFPSVCAPTLVLHHAGDLRVRVEAGRYLGRHVPGAGYIELLGNDRRPNLRRETESLTRSRSG